MKTELVFSEIKKNLRSPEFYRTDDRLVKCPTMSNLMGSGIL